MLCFVHQQKNKACQTVTADVPAKHFQLFFEQIKFQSEQKFLAQKQFRRVMFSLYTN